MVAMAVSYEIPLLLSLLVPALLAGSFNLVEVAEAQHAIRVLGGRLLGFTQVELPTVAETRYLVMIDKVAATPPRYPRRPGIPAKRPL